MNTKLKYKIINQDCNLQELLDFVEFDSNKIIGFDTETTHEAMPEIWARYNWNPSEKINEEVLWEKCVKQEPNAVAKGFWEPLYEKYSGEKLKKWSKVQFKKAFKELNNALNPRNCFVSCVQFGTYNKKEDYYRVVLIQHIEETTELIKSVLHSLKTKDLLMHNGGFDVEHCYASFGILLDTKIIDTRITSAIVKGKRDWKSLSLRNMCTNLGVDSNFAKRKENPLEVNWSQTRSLEDLMYGIRDITSLFLVWEKLKPVVLFENAAKPCLAEYNIVWKIAYASVKGICLDEKEINAQIDAYREDSNKIKERLGDTFPNVTEKANVLNWVNEKFGVSLTSVEKKKFFGDKSLVSNKKLRETMEDIFKLSSNESQISFLKPLLKQGVIHPVYHSVSSAAHNFSEASTGGTVTGRMTSGIHITPKKRRKAYVPREGHTFISADYNAIQFWIVADYSQDPTMMKLYEEGIDPHTYLAGQIYKDPTLCMKSKSEMTPEEVQYRQNSKMGNFGFIFGLWHTSFQKKAYAQSEGEVDLTEAESKKIRDAFFSTFSTIERWHNKMFAFGVLNGYTETRSGRRRYWDREQFLKDLDFKKKEGWYVPELKPVLINGVRYTDREIMERYTDWSWRNICYNTPIQGTEADGFKEAINLIPSWLTQLIWVHDGIVVECPLDRVEEGKKALRDCMIEGMRKYVPTGKVDVELEVLNYWR